MEEKKIVLRTAVLSDIHIPYRSNGNLKLLTKNYERLASAISKLNILADGKLDVIMLLGDYTYTGNPFHAESFAQCLKVITNGIFSESKSPHIMFAYGNHDTCWDFDLPIKYRSIEVSDWESLFKRYSLFPCAAETDGIGSYHLTVTKNNGRYHFITLQTEGYNPNIFSKKTLDWLDNILSYLPKDQYIYIGSHAPIQSSGVFGTNDEIERKSSKLSAGIGSDELHLILSKYPNVIYLSGHTHFSQLLDSCIMQKNYTALCTSPTLLQNFYSLASPYVNSTQRLDTGMGLYIETDTESNLLIHRVSFEESDAYAEITVDYENSHDMSIRNPAYLLPDEPEFISDIRLSGCKSVKCRFPDVCGESFYLPKPSSDCSHLRLYTADTRRIIPRYPKGAFVIIRNSQYDSVLKQFNAEIEFQQCDTPVFHYRIAFLDEDNAPLNEVWVLGNRFPVTDGTKFEGETHLSAKKLTYKLKEIPCVALPRAIKITPVNEFADLGDPIYAELR